MADRPEDGTLFAFFNEIGIIAQLSRTVMEAELPVGLIAPHFGVVNHLVRVRDGQTPLTLARAFQVPKTTMTHTLAGLEKAGLITFAPNPKDARSKCVWLTDKGRTFREETISTLGPPFAELLTEVDPDAIRAALPLLTRIRQVLDTMRDTD